MIMGAGHPLKQKTKQKTTKQQKRKEEKNKQEKKKGKWKNSNNMKISRGSDAL